MNLLDETLLFHFTNRTRKDITSVGSLREYAALVCFGVEETTIEKPCPIRRITYTRVQQVRLQRTIQKCPWKKKKKSWSCLESIFISFVISYKHWEDIIGGVKAKSVKQILQGTTFIPVNSWTNLHNLFKKKFKRSWWKRPWSNFHSRCNFIRKYVELMLKI